MEQHRATVGRKDTRLSSVSHSLFHPSQAGVDAVGWKAQASSHLLLSTNYFSFPSSASMISEAHRNHLAGH